MKESFLQKVSDAFVFPELLSYSSIIHGIFSKPYSFKDIGTKLNTSSIVFDENIKILTEFFNVGYENIFIPVQTHSNKVVIVDEITSRPVYCDAFITNKSNICIGVATADCLPVFIVDYVKNIIAVIHAGWRGLDSEIISKTITVLVKKFDVNPQNILAFIGPSICVNHYEIKKDVKLVFDRKYEKNEIIIKKDDKYFLDLKSLAIIQLVNSGIDILNICNSNICTYEDTGFYSARKDGLNTGRFLSCIMINS